MEKNSPITEERSVPSFSSVKINGIGSLYLKQGDTPSVTVKAPAAIIHKIKSDVSGDTLTIKYRFSPVKWIRSAGHVKDIEIHAVTPHLESISCNGAANIHSESTLEGDTLSLKSAGAGSIQLDVSVRDIIVKSVGAGNIILTGKADTQEANISGAGKLEAYGLSTKASMIDSRGSGHCMISVSDSLSVTIRGVGRVKYKGQPKITSNITGLGSLESGN